MKNLRLTLIACACAATAAFLMASRGGIAAVERSGAMVERPAAVGCAQWEIMTTPAARTTVDAKALPELGKPLVEAAPAGWEPFAFSPQGALVYRRCAKP